MKETKGKWLLVAAWVVAVITLIITSPVAFVLLADSVQNPSLYWIGLVPLAYLALIIWAQVAYRRGSNDVAQIVSCFSIAVDIASLVYLAYLILGMPFT